MKTCKQCNKGKPYSEFQHNASSNDGYRSFCKACMKNRYTKESDKETFNFEINLWEPPKLGELPCNTHQKQC